MRHATTTPADRLLELAPVYQPAGAAELSLWRILSMVPPAALAGGVIALAVALGA